MKNRSRLMTGLMVGAALTFSACAQQAGKSMAETDMMEGQKMKTEAGRMDNDAKMKKEQTQEQNKTAM